MYNLIDATSENVEVLKKYKLDTILEYADNLEEDELDKIKSYVESEVPKMLFSYKMIIVSNKKIGAVCVRDYEDGIILDEIYLENEYRSKGIGTDIIKNIINNNDIVYLWVYKDNIKAIKLYDKLGFKCINETETRMFMKVSK